MGTRSASSFRLSCRMMIYPAFSLAACFDCLFQQQAFWFGQRTLTGERVVKFIGAGKCHAPGLQFLTRLFQAVTHGILPQLFIGTGTSLSSDRCAMNAFGFRRVGLLIVMPQTRIDCRPSLRHRAYSCPPVVRIPASIRNQDSADALELPHNQLNQCR